MIIVTMQDYASDPRYPVLERAEAERDSAMMTLVDHERRMYSMRDRVRAGTYTSSTYVRWTMKVMRRQVRQATAQYERLRDTARAMWNQMSVHHRALRDVTGHRAFRPARTNRMRPPEIPFRFGMPWRGNEEN